MIILIGQDVEFVYWRSELEYLGSNKYSFDELTDILEPEVRNAIGSIALRYQVLLDAFIRDIPLRNKVQEEKAHNARLALIQHLNNYLINNYNFERVPNSPSSLRTGMWFNLDSIISRYIRDIKDWAQK